jgi:peptide/nickel transport system substrate-binding protein
MALIILAARSRQTGELDMDRDKNYWLRRAEARVRRRTFLGGVAAGGAGLAALSAVGCGDDDDAPAPTAAPAAPTQAAGSQPAATQPAAAAASPTAAARKEGDRIRIAIGAEPTTVDPHNLIGGVDNFYLNQMFNALYENDTKGVASPALAASSEVTPDGLQITFKLRPGVTFHDGSAMTADDVLYSFQRAMSDEAKGTKTVFVNVERGEVVDRQTFVYRMKKPDAGFVLGGFGGLRILPKAYAERVGFDGFSNAPVGTGAFTFKARNIGTGATFDRFDNYWAGKAAFKHAEMKVVPDGTSRLQMLQVGEVDGIAALPPEQLALAKNMSGVKLITQPANIDTYFGFAVKEYPGTPLTETQKMLGDRRVRQAINYAVDKKAIAEKLYGTELARPYAVTNPDQPWHLGKYYEYDINKAKSLLAEAGAGNMSLTLFGLGGGRLPGLAALNAAVASNIRDSGIRVTETVEEYNAWLSRLRNDTPPFPETGMVFSWASTAGGTEPFSYIDSKWLCSARYGHWCDDVFDDMVAAARAEFDTEKRNALIKKAMSYMYDEAPGLWLVLLDEAYGFRSSVVAGWRPRSGSTPVIRLEDVDAA